VERETSLRAVIPRGLGTLRAQWGAIVGVSALVLIPTAALQGQVLVESGDELDSGWFATSLLVIAAVAVSGLGYFFLKGVIAQIVVAYRGDHERPSLGSIAVSLPYATLIAVDLILVLGVTLGLALLVIPGIVIGTWFALAPILVETEHLGIRRAFRRSRELVRGNFWEVLLILFTTLALVGGLHWAIEELTEEAAGGLSEDLETGIGLLLAGILVKPVGAVITIELCLALSASKGRPA
jgi:hypothetical protein